MLTHLVVVLAAAASPAEAQTNSPSRAAVFVSAKESVGDVSEANAAADKAQAHLTKVLGEAGVPLADVPTLFPPSGPPATGAKLVKEGIDAFDNLDTDAAGAKFREALGFFEQNPGAADTKTLAELHLFLGTIAMQNGKTGKKKADEELTRAAVLDPRFELNPKYFGPDVKKEWEKVVKEVEAKPKDRLTFNSVPAGADVSFRGKSLGLTPVATPVSVSPGRHLVTFKHAGYEPSGLLVDVSGDTEAKTDLKPVAGYAAQRTKMHDVLPGNFDGKTVPNAAVGVAEAMKSRFLVVAEVDVRGDGKLEVWDTAKGNRLKGVSLASGSYNSAVDQVKKFMTNPAPLDAAPAASSGGDGAVASVESGSDEPITKKWWFWTAIGVVVVGGAAAGVAIGASQSHGGGYNPALGTF